MKEGVLAWKVFSVLVDDVVGIGHFLQDVDEGLLSELLYLLGSQLPIGYVLFDFLNQLFCSALYGFPQLFYVTRVVLRLLIGLLVPAAIFKYYMAISISHLLRLNLLP
jgi:hypothetical protein